MSEPARKLLVVLDQSYLVERKKALIHWICARHSIPKDRLSILCCYDVKTKLPKQKKERLKLLRPDLEQSIKANGDCVIVGLGAFPCEYLTNASLVNTKAGTSWSTKRFGKVWIAKSPDAALINPGEVVQIARVLISAAEDAGIETRFDPKVPQFRWEEYEFKH